MAKKKRKARARSGARDLHPSTKRTIGGIIEIAAGLLLFFALQDEAGVLGERIHAIMTFFFGQWSILFTIFLVATGLFHTFAPGSRIEVKRTTGLILCLLCFLGLMTAGADVLRMGEDAATLGGALGFMTAFPLVHFLGIAGAYVVLVSGLVIGVFLSFEPDLGAAMETIKSLFAARQSPVLAKHTPRMAKAPPVVQEEEEEEAEEEEDADDLIEDDGEAPELNIVRPPSLAQITAKAKTEQLIKSKLKAVAGDVLEMKDTRFEEWTFPSMDLLDATHAEFAINDEELKKNAKLIEEKLEEFGIDVKVRDAKPGPTVTQFTLQPAEGVKLSKIENLKNDLALALAAQSLRIEAPIPGKSLVGIEMPNLDRTTVHMREILESSAFGESESTLTLPLGRDVSGDVVIASIEDMPHLLIAGATGSGKSVCMNVLLTSLLYQNAPHELKFILIDPKRVELMPYNGIPHLLTPVITEAEKALQALRWAVAEMGRRLHRFSEQGARNIAEYNEKQTDEGNRMPRIIIVIDELADLMMRQFRRDTETMIVRIAQMARAVGMHLVIATQRPSVDVITGLIKANIPTRIAFRVVSSVDSRTILDGIGAEDLLGKGDMLYMTAATPKPVRIQGIYVGGKEIERVINAVKIAGGGKVTEQIGLAENEEEGEGPSAPTMNTAMIDLEADDNGGDDLFFEAVKVVQISGKASASLLQRQMKVGYARAARLLDIMEEKGIVGPADGAKPRKVYIERQTLESTQG